MLRCAAYKVRQLDFFFQPINCAALIVGFGCEALEESFQGIQTVGDDS